MRKPTWKLVDWPLLAGRLPDGEIDLICPKCGHEAAMPTLGHCGDSIIASCGLSLIFDSAGHKPPAEFMPAAVQCRVCRTVWSSSVETSNVA